jgi:hypothetical protein
MKMKREWMGRWWRRGGWNNRSIGLCEEQQRFSGRTAACPSLFGGRHGRRSLAKQHITNTHPRWAVAGPHVDAESPSRRVQHVASQCPSRPPSPRIMIPAEPVSRDMHYQEPVIRLL